MAKRGFVAVLIFLSTVLLSGVSAVSIDDEFKKLANYAGEYETGNIDYVQLLIYTSSARGKMNELLGAAGRDTGGVLKQEQIKKILGEPIEETKWAWSERDERETKLDNPVPVWKKIIFDGRKIQIRLSAWPSIFSKKEFWEEPDNKDKKNNELKDLEGRLIYRLNFEIEFKKPEEQLNIQGKINEIQTLAQAFSSGPSSGNAEALAKESVNAERAFQSYFRQSGGKCEDIMNSIFGTENKRKTQQLLVQEINFCEGDNFEVIARLEMCDECEWNWVNIDFRVEGRGPGFKPKEGEMNALSPKSFENMDVSQLEEEIRKIIDEIKQLCSNRDFNAIIGAKNKLWPLNEAWNQKSNNVWEEVDKTFKSQIESMTQEQRREFDQNYGWIKQEQEKRKKVKELSKSNYEKRKQFYLSLFSGYDKKESSYTQIEFEKRLIEEFKEKGEEICNNNQDDNKNEAIDCADEQCGGKICGIGKNIVQEGNETKDIETNLYCIEKECKVKEEIKEIVRNVSIACSELPSIECSEGSRVFFSRYDNETNCPIETSCLEETESCNVNGDCIQPACGIAECLENRCTVTGLTECRELECTDGDERICELDGSIVEICNNGFWEETGECEEEPEIRDEVVIGNECSSANDCESDNVCNNGVCQVLPQVIIREQEEQATPEQTPETATQEQTSNEPSPEATQESREIVGNVIFAFARTIFSKMKTTGASITGFEAEETQATQTPIETIPTNPSQPTETSRPEPTQSNQEQNQQEVQQPEAQQPENQPAQNQQIPNDNQQSIENRNQDDKREREENREREKEEEQRKEENKERCKNDCKRPCIEKCIRKECGEELNCMVDETQKKCEGTCEAGNDCIEKCMQGGEWWKEFENKDEHKEEKGVFQAGGSCRTSQGKTEGFIWFGGWGEPFEQIQYLKNKYYSGGQADWCKYDFENLKKQRQEFEKGFNQEFIAWFFEKYLANSAENWEQSVSGIFELYWKDVDNSREMAYRMNCLEIDELPSINLINVKYETDYGKLEFWEEIKTVKLPGMDKEMQIISPYMKAWIFPPKEFIIYEMKKGMKNHEFPGPPEEKVERENEEGPTAEEREMIKQDKKFMEQIREISEKYGGNLDIAIQFKDYEANEIVFNLYAQVNENDIIKIEPMLPEEVPAEDIKVEIDFKIIYDMIYESEKEMRGEMVESPPWDKKIRPMQKIKEIVGGIKMYLKMRKIMNSAKITPAESEKDVKNLFKKFMSMMMKEGKGPGGHPKGESDNKDNVNSESDGVEKEVWESKEAITGEIIFNYR